MTTDQRIDPAGLGLFIEVDAIGLEGFRLLLGRTFFLLTRWLLAGFTLFLDTARWTRLRRARPLANTVGNIVDGIIAGHFLFLQEVSRMAFTLGKDRHQNIGTRHFFPTGRLDMDDSPLDDPLEAGGGFGILIIAGHQIGQLIIDVIAHRLAQRIEVHIAGAHHSGGIGIIDQCHQQMFKRCVFVVALIGKSQCLMQRLFQARRKCWHGQILISFP